MVAILSGQREAILEAVRGMYTDVASHPTRDFHFPVGRAACEWLGYPAPLLDAVPPGVLEPFAGVGYPFAAGVIRPGDTVLDVGCGSGTDVLIASRLAGPAGRVFGMDVTPAMLDRLGRTPAGAGGARIELLEGDAEAIPLPDGCVDVVTSNGVLNLVTHKRPAVAELYRVLRPGGRVQISDIVLAKPVSEACAADPRLWVECVVGATLEDAYLDLFREAGFDGLEVLGSLDYFSASSSRDTRAIAAALGARALTLRARK